MDKWNAIKESIDGSQKKIRVLPANENAAQAALARYNIPADSVLGSVVTHSGGIIIDDRLRIYGSGGIGISDRNEQYHTGSVIVAEDIYGGFFFFGEDGRILYFAPDTLAAEETGCAYSQFLFWAVTGDTDGFYSNFIYDGWKSEAEGLPDDMGISFYPPPWTKEGKDPEQCSRKVIPMKEIIGMELDILAQLENVQN